MFTLIKENRIKASIPDSGSISDSISIKRNGNIRDIRISAQIKHPFISDISLSIAAPSGKEVLLRNRQMKNASNSNIVFQGKILADLIGEQAKGNWTLTATDNASKDRGTLDSWSIEIDCEEYQHHSEEIFIPGAQSNELLLSAQECRFSGRVLEAEIDIEVTHPLIGDLVISIISPSGRELILHDRSGGSQKQLKKKWSGTVLNQLKGDITQGTWTLKVKNFHPSNDGLLKYWKIKFLYEPEDDLKVVEGIGPKIEELLKNAGIFSFVSLATSTPETIKEILNEAGDRYKMHDPGSWPNQAAFAAQGRWEELDQLKDQLKGGR